MSKKRGARKKRKELILGALFIFMAMGVFYTAVLPDAKHVSEQVKAGYSELVGEETEFLSRRALVEEFKSGVLLRNVSPKFLGDSSVRKQNFFWLVFVVMVIILFLIGISLLIFYWYEKNKEEILR